MHKPVLLNEVLEYLDPKPGENFIDATLGTVGHTAAILAKTGPQGRILGIDVTPELFKKAAELKIKNDPFDTTQGHPERSRTGEKLKNRLILVNDSFTNLEDIVAKYNFWPVHGILLDLGMSSWHLEESERGFSFKKDEILDMRYNPLEQGLLAKDILNYWPALEIEKIFRDYGEERFARKIVKRIVEERKKKKIETTKDLINIIAEKKTGGITYKFQNRNRRHPATKIFQALRIAVNDELENLKIVLPQTINILIRGGRLVVISFHSLEDRIVKNFLKEKTREGSLQILTKKPIRPNEEEIKLNPRSRSAKLRAAIKL